MLEPWNDLAAPDVAPITEDGRQMLGVRCTTCGRIDFPAVPFCRVCLTETTVSEALDPDGVLYAFTTIRTAAEPYMVGYVDLDNGLRAFGHIAGEAGIGTRMTLGGPGLPITFMASEKGDSQ